MEKTKEGFFVIWMVVLFSAGLWFEKHPPTMTAVFLVIVFLGTMIPYFKTEEI